MHSTFNIQHSKLLLFLLIPFVLSSCSQFDPPVVVPVYGHIDSIHFSVPTDSANIEGTASANIPYAWVYLDDNPIGAFQMPCTFPMITGNGMHNISIYPGIIPAGANSPAGINPFYQYYSINVNLQQGSTVKFKPTSTYFNWVKFIYMENFESEPPNYPPTRIVNYPGSGGTGGSDTTMLVTNNSSQVFGRHGNSGVVTIDKNHPYYIGMTNPWDSLPTNGSTPVYVELNYKSSALFAIGLIEGDTANVLSPSVVVYPSSTWTKMYVVLQTTLATYSVEPYRIYFSMSLPSGDVSDQLYLDNIKILY